MRFPLCVCVRERERERERGMRLGVYSQPISPSKLTQFNPTMWVGSVFKGLWVGLGRFAKIFFTTSWVKCGWVSKFTNFPNPTQPTFV